MSQPAILSDIGNVLVSFDFTLAARRAAEHCPHPPEHLLTRLDSIKLPYENGEMDDATNADDEISRAFSQQPAGVVPHYETIPR